MLPYPYSKIDALPETLNPAARTPFDVIVWNRRTTVNEPESILIHSG
jgi:hypothetical protein